MNIYVASSWRNAYQPAVVSLCREFGHAVYDFRNPGKKPGGFHWSDIDPGWRSWKPAAFRNALKDPIAERGFKADMDALLESDACLMVCPCGRSAHLELGWAVGSGLVTAILYPDAGMESEAELMQKMADRVLVGMFELDQWLENHG